MAVYNLTGSGTVGLTAETTRLIIDVVTFDPNRTIGRATPPNYYDLGLLRLGVQGSYGITQPIDAASMFMDCPEGVTTLGYSLFGQTAIRVTEQFTSDPNTLLQPWDRNPIVVTQSGNANASPNTSRAQLWTYTVPAGLIFRCTLMQVECAPFSTPSAQNGTAFSQLVINGVGAVIAFATGGGAVGQNGGFAGGAFDMPAGTVLTAFYQNLLTDVIAGVWAAVAGYTFNA